MSKLSNRNLDDAECLYVGTSYLRNGSKQDNLCTNEDSCPYKEVRESNKDEQISICTM